MNDATQTNRPAEGTMKTKRIEAGMYEAKVNGYTVTISKLVYETTYWTFDVRAADGAIAEYCCGAYETKKEAVAAAARYVTR